MDKKIVFADKYDRNDLAYVVIASVVSKLVRGSLTIMSCSCKQVRWLMHQICYKIRS